MGPIPNVLLQQTRVLQCVRYSRGEMERTRQGNWYEGWADDVDEVEKDVRVNKDQYCRYCFRVSSLE